MHRVAPPSIAIAALFLQGCDGGILCMSFAFLAAVAGPITFVIVTVHVVIGVRDRWRERRRLGAEPIGCAQAIERARGPAAIAGTVSCGAPLRDPITGDDVVFYEILIGGASAVAREIVAGAMRSVYGVPTLKDVRREARAVPFSIADDGASVRVEPDGAGWMCVDPSEPDAAQASYLRERAPDGVWIVHRCVRAGARVLAVGMLETRSTPDAGYRGALRDEICLVVGPDGALVGTGSRDDALARLGYGEVFSIYAVGAVITLIVTALGFAPFVIAWLIE